MGLCGIVFGVVITFRGGAPITVGDGPAYYRHLGFGYWAWVLSFACLTVALRAHTSELAMAEKPEKEEDAGSRPVAPKSRMAVGQGGDGGRGAAM